MVDDYDYQMDDVDRELIYIAAQRIIDAWDGLRVLTDDVETEEV